MLSIENKISDSSLAFYLCVLIFFATCGISLYLKKNMTVLFRLLPELIFIGLFSLQSIIYFLYYSKKQTRFIEPVISWFEKSTSALWLSILFSVPILFYDAIKKVYPLGFSGLYTLMAQEIVQSNFKLPTTIPYYGPGGIPFAYPPLGAYIMGIFLKLGGSQWDYLRFAPPIFSLCAILCMFLLVKKLTKSNLAAFTSSILTAISFDLFFLQSESGGIFRALAFCLGLLSVYFFINLIEKPGFLYAALSGLAFGLCTLTHLGYAYYFVFWLVAWQITHLSKKNILWSFLSGAIALGSISPWLFTVINRYGVNVIFNAFQTHNTTYFLQIFSSPTNIVPAVLQNLNVLIIDWKLLILVMIGIIGLLFRKEFAFPLLFIFNSLFIFEGNRFVLFLSFVLAGYGLKFIFDIITKNNFLLNIPVKKSLFSIFIACFLFFSYLQSFFVIAAIPTLINKDMINMANYLEAHSSKESKYLALITGDSQADEWIPYLSNRVPLIGFWGSEWTGQSTQQEELTQLKIDCSSIQKKTCLESLFEKLDEKPEYLFVEKKIETLSENLRSDPAGKVIYENSRYLLFQYYPEK